MAGMAILFLVVALWTLSKGDLLEATGHGLVVILAASAAFLFANPRLSVTTQRRVTVGALTLVPIILTILVASFFL